MKKNYLFINVFLFYILAFLGFVIYSKNIDYNGDVLFNDTDMLKKILLWFACAAVLPLILSIPLGIVKKGKKFKVDNFIVQILIMIFFAAIVQILNSAQYTVSFFSNISDYYVSGFSTYNYEFYICGAVAFVAFYYLVVVLKFIASLLFVRTLPKRKVNLEEFRKMKVLSTLFMFGVGILACVGVYYSGLWYGNYFEYSKTIFGYTFDYTFGTTDLNTTAVSCFVAYVVVYFILRFIASNKAKGYVRLTLIDILFFIISIAATYTLYNNMSITFHYFWIFYVCGMLTLIVVYVVAYILRVVINYLIGYKKPAKETGVAVVGNKDIDESNAVLVKNYDNLVSKLSELEIKVNEPAPASIIDNRFDNKDEQKSLTVNAVDTSVTDALNSRIDELEQKMKAFAQLSAPASNQIQTKSNQDSDPRYEKEYVTILSRGFKSKLINADDKLKQLYSDLLNFASTYKKVHVRHSFAKDTIYIGRKNIAILKMSPSSKRMYIYFSLDKDKYLNSKYHLKDYSDKLAYATTPLRLNVKSDRSIKYALELLEFAIDEKECEKFSRPRDIMDYTKDLTPLTEDEMIEVGLIKKQVIEETYLVEGNGNQISKTNVDLDNEDEEEDESDDETDDDSEDSGEEK